MSNIIKNNIPNYITTGNLICGCMGTLAAFKGELQLATFLLWGGLFLDFFDGFSARLLKVSSPLGKELDSLADLITFGFLPSAILYQLIQPFEYDYLVFVVAVGSAWRLAKFNIDERQSDIFIGLPTPANALFLSSFVFLEGTLKALTQDPWILLMLAVVFSWLLISPIRLFSLKFKSANFASNKLRYIYLLICLILLIILQLQALPLLILAYIVLSVVQNIFFTGTNE